MRKTCTGVVAGVASVLLLSASAAAQGDVPRSPWKYYPADVRANAGPGGGCAGARSDRDMDRRVNWRGC